jgi:hypothetical protein
MQNKTQKILIIWNIILTFIVVVLIYGSYSVSSETSKLSSENISQNVVLCTYIEDILMKTGVSKELPNCQFDIEENLNFIRK